jgi:GNAT superfamily N-acetyltransferase
MLVEVREATEGDLEPAIRLIEEYYLDLEIVVRDSPAELDRYRIWLAWCDGIPAGCILLRGLPEVDGAGEIKRMYVRPQFRRFGLAKQLLQALEKHATSAGLRWLYLDTKDDLVVAIEFYRRNGFVDCERYNANPQATIFMRKKLAEAAP